MNRISLFTLAALTSFAVWGADSPADPAFARYRSIIDRMPFGEPPPNFDPTAAPGSAAAAAAEAEAAGGMTEEQRTEEEQKLASSVRVSVLNITPAGRTMVGFTDSSAKPPAHYYLPVGGERDGWMVKEADPATEKVKLAKGELEVTLKLGEGSSDGNKNSKNKGGAPRMNQPPRRNGFVGARLTNGPNASQPAAENPPAAGAPLGAMARLRERRVRQLQEQKAEAARRAEAAAEEKAENERKAAEAKAAAEQAAAEREQQRAALLQIQEELRRQREENEKKRNQEESESTQE